jgi:hypothetical protein
MDTGLRNVLFIAIEKQGFVHLARLRTQDIIEENSLFYLLSLTIGSKDILLRPDLYKRYFSAKLIFSFPGQLPILCIHRRRLSKWHTVQLGQLSLLRGPGSIIETSMRYLGCLCWFLQFKHHLL